MERSRTSFVREIPPFSPPPDPGGRVGAAETPEALAHRVLFSDCLEEKLRPRPLAGPGSPREPSPSLPRTVLPARPRELRFARSGGTRPSLPGRPGLVDDENRGILLHFFANHELLAAELMALALLKFPEAPETFRRGLAATLKEEQHHTRWYLSRMRECGVEFGQYPLSPYFWEAVSPMESPLDYVSRLSLTFEQANLDYARHYSEVLAEAGDPRSASILRRIYEDEIGHVGYGLHWFRQWKEEGESDWSALRKRLPFPLSPSRAKGNRTAFNEEGRRAAGFDEDYIRRLSLFRRSKGRTPDVFYFNPEAEHRAARWPLPYHPDRDRHSVILDLELLSGFVAKRDDVLLLRRPPSEAHLAKLASCGLDLPEIEVLAGDGRIDAGGLLAGRKVHALHPWALAPDLGEVFGPLTSSPASGNRLPWDQGLRSLFSKIEQAAALGPWMGTTRACRSPAELAVAAAELHELGHPRLVLKRAFSTAGSGIVPLEPADLARGRGPAFSAAVEHEGGMLLEPRHERRFDFSVQYRIEKGGIRLKGFVEQVIRGLGGYRGSLCRTKFCKGLDPELARFLMERCLPTYAADGELASALLDWLGSRGYEGPVGIDSYVHFHEGALVHRPICEVNPRHTMGLVALALKRRIEPGRDLAFSILKASDLDPSVDSPVVRASGRLAGGSLILTEVGPQTRFAAVARIP